VSRAQVAGVIAALIACNLHMGLVGGILAGLVVNWFVREGGQ
jgi:fructose-specific phosphotransferase system IIC component